jgi:protein involved in polysaccharide export with SLBB domain
MINFSNRFLRRPGLISCLVFFSMSMTINAQTDSALNLFTTPIADTVRVSQAPAVVDTSKKIKQPDAQPVTIADTTHAQIPSKALSTAGIRGFAKPGEAIRVYAYPDTGSFVNGFYPVDGQGRIYLPIIGKMYISDMTEQEFLDTLKKQYINYLRYPNLQVRHLIRISLLGGFQKPGLYYIDPDFSMWDAVYQTGGTTREDGLKRMRWERDRLMVAEDIIPYYQSGQSLSSIGFKSGDQLWTPVDAKKPWWEVVFRDAILSYIFPVVSTTASLYISYMTYKTYYSR